jgi:hypothetical protein
VIDGTAYTDSTSFNNLGSASNLFTPVSDRRRRRPILRAPGCRQRFCSSRAKR